MRNYRQFESPGNRGLGDGRTVEALSVGDVSLRMLFKVSDSKLAVLRDVLYVPKLSYNPFLFMQQHQMAMLYDLTSLNVGFIVDLES